MDPMREENYMRRPWGSKDAYEEIEVFVACTSLEEIFVKYFITNDTSIFDDSLNVFSKCP